MANFTLASLLESHPQHDSRWKCADGSEWQYNAGGLMSIFPNNKAGWIVTKLGHPIRFYMRDELPALSNEDLEQRVEQA